MTSDTRTPDEIERDIERERAQLASTVDELQDRFSPEAIVKGVVRGFSDHGGDVGHAISKSVKQNPVALALTGAGLAWLMFGRSYDDRPDSDYRSRYRGRTRHNDDYDDDDDDDDIGSFSSLRRSRRRLSAHATAPGRHYEPSSSWAYADEDLDDDAWDDDDWDDDGASYGERAADAASRAGRTVADGGRAAGDAVKSGAGSVADAATSGAASVASGAQSAAGGIASGARSAVDGASNAASVTARRAKMMRQRLAEGTENMSEAAREKVIAARARFIETRRKADAAARRKASRGADAVGDFIEEQPLVAGALAIAVGAALAGALPRTRMEDDLVGEQSDAAFDEAERIFQRERRKAGAVAKAAVDEASTIAQETRAGADNAADGSKSAIEHAADEVREAGKRVAGAATEEADKQDLGKPKV